MKQADGSKHDNGKLLWDLMPWPPLSWVVKVLMFGAKKYGEHNWLLVKDARRRYLNAALRHVIDLSHEQMDPESELPHAAHAICCLLFYLHFSMVEEKP